MQFEENNTTSESNEENAVRELDESMLLEALKETSIGTAGAVQVWAPSHW